MPDKSLTITSFKYGLDTRRESLASLPGTLQTLQNAFINSGGEIEKRRAFVLVGTLPTGSNTFKPFGFQDTDTGIMVFSSDASPGGLPTNIVWQQLSFPTNPAPGVLSLVVYSTSFKGKSFALISFDNEQAIFAYYNGSLVNQITDGIVLLHPGGGGAPETISDLATDLAGIVNRIPGWLAHANVTNLGLPSTSPIIGYNEGALAGSVLVMTPVGVRLTPTIQNNNSAAGLIGVRLLDQDYQGIPATSAVVGFQLVSTGTNTGDTVNISAPTTSGGLNYISITNGAVTYNAGGLGQTAQDIATAINNYTFVSGYTAYAVPLQAAVVIFAPASFGKFTSNLQINITSTGTNLSATCIAAGSIPPPVVAGYFMTLTPQNLDASSNHTGVPHSITASVTGQNSTVTFTWTKVSNDSNEILYSTDGWRTSGGIPGVTPAIGVTGPTCSFMGYGTADKFPMVSQFKCVAHNATQPDVTVTFYVRFAIT